MWVIFRCLVTQMTLDAHLFVVDKRVYWPFILDNPFPVYTQFFQVYSVTDAVRPGQKGRILEA